MHRTCERLAGPGPVLFVVSFLLSPSSATPGASNVHYVTMLTTPGGDAMAILPEYHDMLENWVSLLNRSGVARERMIVATTPDVLQGDLDRVRKLGTLMRTLPLVTLHSESESHMINEHYAMLCSKLNLWNMTEFSKLVYADVDLVFLSSPASCVDQCPESASLCAVPDALAVSSFGKPKAYFNSGFMVIHPDTTTHQRLTQNLLTEGARGSCVQRQFPDQDALNDVFLSEYVALPSRCNTLHPTRENAEADDNVQTKLSELRTILPQDHWARDILFGHQPRAVHMLRLRERRGHDLAPERVSELGHLGARVRFLA